MHVHTPVCRLCGRYLAILGKPIRITVPAVTVAPTALVGSLIRASNLPHSLRRGVHYNYDLIIILYMIIIILYSNYNLIIRYILDNRLDTIVYKIGKCCTDGLQVKRAKKTT